jgi:phage baseplate assembly protein W
VQDRDQARIEQRRAVLGRAPAFTQVMPGTDLGRDIGFEVGANGRDIAFVSGIDALGQSLSIALTTLAGSDLFNTGFGFDGLVALVEETNPILQRERIRIGVIRVLEQDPRVRRIIDVKLGDDRLDRVPAGGRELQVRVIFEAMTGEQITAELGRIATLTT